MSMFYFSLSGLRNKMFLSSFILLLFLFSFSFTLAAPSGLIPCDGTETTMVNGKTVVTGCTFDHFVQLAQTLINYLIYISIPITALAFSYAGFLMLTSAGSEEKVKHGKDIFTHVMIGFLFVLGGWLIVYTITTALLANPNDYSLLK